MSDHSAKLAPHPKPLKSTDQLVTELNVRLKDDFCLDPLPLYVIVVEGWSDLKYLHQAAALARLNGVDLLSAPSPHDKGSPIPIAIVTPGRKGDPSRGGVEQLVRLAKEIRAAVFSYEAYLGVAFVFDHDEAGIKGRDCIADHGFKADLHSITLDPRKHPSACTKKQAVIEDLLSIRVQLAFFDQGAPWCSAEYESGQLTRYAWGHQSKGHLQEYVAANATWSDLEEVARVLDRVRQMWGLPALLGDPVKRSDETPAATT